MSVFASRLIENKRDGAEHSTEEMESWIDGFLKGKVADYQMTAWLMAVYLNGMSDRETTALTSAMLHSGDSIVEKGAHLPRIDKHSTGGVGDKLSLPLVGIAAACGLNVPMIAGRGLGHTGGTLDKLESISGFSVQLDARKFSQVVRRTGACIIGQTAKLAPADRRIYALRDVTGTVACRPLIVASILSKKLAAGLDGLVLDVKVGRGAFMKQKKDARALAQSLVRVSSELGTPATALLTNMDRPLGRSIGNALEVRESIDILKGNGPPDSTWLTLELVSSMLMLAGLASNQADGRVQAQTAIDSGLAFERFCMMVQAQGGDARQIEDPRLLPQARYQVDVPSPRSGSVSDIEPLSLALLAQDMGAGRRLVTDQIDPSVGIELKVAPGDRVKKGQPLCTLHTQQSGTAQMQQIEKARAAFAVGRAQISPSELVLGRVRPQK